MARGFRRSRSFRSGKRRKLDWGRAFGTEFGTSVPVDQTAILAAWLKCPAEVLTPGTDNKEPEDMTLVRGRLRYSYHIVSDAGVTIGNAMRGRIAWGALVWEGIDCDDPDPLTVPAPDTEGNADWIHHQFYMFEVKNQVGSTLFPSFFPSSEGYELQEWSKSQRKLSSMQGILLVTLIENQGSVPLAWDQQWFYRALFKLP